MLDSLLPTRVVFYRAKPNEADAATVDEYRFTVTTYSVMQASKRKVCVNQARAWFESVTGRTVDSYFETPETDQDDKYVNQADLINMSWAWASIMAGISKIEHRQANGDDKAAWETVQIPVAWLDIETFLSSVDSELLNALAGKVYELNLQLLGIAQDEQAKKFGVISAI